MDPSSSGDGEFRIVSTCPKCGFRQDGGIECGRCGIVFAKFQSRRDWVPLPEVDRTEQRVPSAVRGYFRALRWFTFAASLVLLYLLIQPAAAPMIPTSTEAAEIAEVKLHRFQQAVREGRPRELQLSELELNSWLKPRLDLVRESPAGAPAGYSTPVSTGAAPAEALSESEAEEVRSSITDVQLDLYDDLVLAYLRFRLYGKEMSFQLEGRLRLDNGYLRLDPVAGKIGLLPIPSYTLQSAARRIFEAEENRERFRLPDYIDDIRVEDGQLFITHRAHPR